MKKVVIASLLAAVVFFIWGFIYWVPIGTAVGIYRPAPNEVALAQALKDNLGSADGFYFVPTDMSDIPTLEARHLAGPIAQISYLSQGQPVMNPSTYGLGFLHYLVSAFLMALVLNWLAPRLRSYGERVKLVAGSGLAAAVFANLGRPLWLKQPWSFHVFEVVYEIVGWLLVGLVLGWFINGSEKR